MSAQCCATARDVGTCLEYIKNLCHRVRKQSNRPLSAFQPHRQHLSLLTRSRSRTPPHHSLLSGSCREQRGLPQPPLLHAEPPRLPRPLHRGIPLHPSPPRRSPGSPGPQRGPEPSSAPGHPAQRRPALLTACPAAWPSVRRRPGRIPRPAGRPRRRRGRAAGGGRLPRCRTGNDLRAERTRRYRGAEAARRLAGPPALKVRRRRAEPGPRPDPRRPAPAPRRAAPRAEPGRAGPGRARHPPT